MSRITLAEITATPFEFTDDERRRLETLSDADIEALAATDAVHPEWTEKELREAVRLRKRRLANARRAADDDRSLAKTR